MSGTQPEASAAAKAQAEAQAIEVGQWVGTKCGTNRGHKIGQCTLCKRCRKCPSEGCASDRADGYGHGRGQGDMRRRSAEDKDASPATIRTLPGRTAAVAVSVGAYTDISEVHIGIKMHEEQGAVSMQDKVSGLLLFVPVVRVSYVHSCKRC
jgi:hypothetical protein